MKLLNTKEFITARQKGERRLNLFRRDNLHTWLLYFPPGDVQRMHNHPSDRTYFVVAGRGIMKGPNETHELSPGMILSIPAHEYYEGSNPYDISLQRGTRVPREVRRTLEATRPAHRSSEKLPRGLLNRCG
jgi:mannose-6-phosphate isomerase-like protein (cupin superfamily)